MGSETQTTRTFRTPDKTCVSRDVRGFFRGSPSDRSSEAQNRQVVACQPCFGELLQVVQQGVYRAFGISRCRKDCGMQTFTAIQCSGTVTHFCGAVSVEQQHVAALKRCFDLLIRTISDPQRQAGLIRTEIFKLCEFPAAAPQHWWKMSGIDHCQSKLIQIQYGDDKCDESIITHRIQEQDIQRIKVKAMEQGIPYQTLVSSILHRYASGRLKEEA